MATPGTEDANKSVLQLFDPLASPSTTRHKTPCSQRQREPTSPVAEFLSSVDRSRSLLATIKKNREVNLIDLGNLQSPMPTMHQNVEPSRAIQTTAPLLATPNPASKISMERRLTTEKTGSDAPVVPVFDPFSPPPASNRNNVAMFSAASMTPRFFNIANNAEKERLIPMETPGRSDLLMSTNFTPIPGNLPYLPGVSLRSLSASSTSSTATKRRRSSIDLGKELQQVHSSDSSFDILRGDMSIGASAEMSFVSINSEELARLGGAATPIGVEESPWTIRTGPSDYSIGDELLPIEEMKEIQILAHEIPLPDSPPSSPESSIGANEDACLNAPKVFPNLRRFSMAKASSTPLQFPIEESPPKDPPLIPGLPYGVRRAHTRTISTTSATSIGSNQSSATIRRPSTPKEAPDLNEKPIQKRPLATGRAKAPSSVNSSPSKASPTARRVPRPSVSIRPLGSRISVGPRPSLAPAPAQRNTGAAPTTVTKGPVRLRGSMAPPPVPTTSGGAARPRMSVATSASRPSISRPTAQNPVVTKRGSRSSIALTGNSGDTTNNVLTTGTRANTTTTRAPRQSLLPSLGETKRAGPTQVSASDDSAPARVTARPRPIGAPKPRPSSMIIPSTSTNPSRSVVPEREVSPPKPVKSIPRPRTSSAGAALISRPPLVGDLTTAPLRPVSVAAHRIARPKSSMSRV
ncbi:hypothetical protein FRC19_003435 [Serendipita sp. 401]|nr:hypothetical protein FRC19_003435 [Serendipita sp. 401]